MLTGLNANKWKQVTYDEANNTKNDIGLRETVTLHFRALQLPVMIHFYEWFNATLIITVSSNFWPVVADVRTYFQRNGRDIHTSTSKFIRTTIVSYLVWQVVSSLDWDMKLLLAVIVLIGDSVGEYALATCYDNYWMKLSTVAYKLPPKAKDRRK